MYLKLVAFNTTIFWLLLSGFWGNGLLLGLGVVSVSLTVYMCWRIQRYYRLKSPASMVLRLPKYSCWLAWEVFKSNIAVVKNIWQPKDNPISPTVKRIPMMQTTSLGQTAFANSITLTPGTVAFNVADNQVLVHAIVEDAVVELMEGEMNPRVADMERGPVS